MYVNLWLCVVQLFRVLKVVAEYFDEFHGWNAREHDEYDIPPNFCKPTILHEVSMHKCQPLLCVLHH